MSASDSIDTGDVLKGRFALAFSWRAAASVCGFVAALGIIAMALGSRSSFHAPGLFWILDGSTVVAELACACVIFGYGYVARSVHGLMIGAAFLLCAFLGARYALAVSAGAFSGPYLWLAWHAAVSALAIVALTVTAVSRERTVSTLEALGAAIALLTGATTIAFALPPALQGLQPTFSPASVALAICAIDVLAIVLMAAVRQLRKATFRTLGIVFFASIVDTLIFLWRPSSGDSRYAEALFGTMAASVILIAFASEFTWRRAVTKATSVYSSSSEIERKQARERLMYLAFHDELTGLNNRTRWQDILRQRLIVAAAEPGQHELAVLFIDLDRFKEINDAGGHAYGDAVLIEAGKRLRACVGAKDTVGRLGGDEFAILCDGSDPDAVARRILKSLFAPFASEQYSCHLAATIGVARFPQDGLGVEELLRNADQALYHGKRRGGQSYNRYDAVMAEERRTKRIVRDALSAAIPNNEFLLHYQPIFNFQNLALESVEALLRWQSATIGPISPSVFIAVAEEGDIMREIGRWTLEAAIAQLGRWPTKNSGPLPSRIAVNVSGRQLRDPLFLEHIVVILEKHGVRATRLELEITESAAMADTDAAVELLERCRKLGMRVTLDDFGTHYSSLTYLQRLPIDTIKIDQSFVHGLPFNDGDGAIVRNIINLGHDMRRKIVAEGVETWEQFDWLERAGCDYAQGFFLAKPMSATDIERRVIADFSRRDKPLRNARALHA